MFDNIGKKIKTLAKIFVYLGSILCIISGLIVAIKFKNNIGYLYIFLGPIFTWISSFILYGFGQLIDNSDKIMQIQQKELKNKTPNFIKSIKSKETKMINTSDFESLYHKAKNKVKKYNKIDQALFQSQYPAWAKQIGNYTLQELYNIFLSEYEEWEEDYILMCCFEIVKKYEASK